MLEVNQGSLYPALYRLQDRGLLQSQWGISEKGRKAKFYSLTEEGRAQFVEERDSWNLFVAAVADVLQAGL